MATTTNPAAAPPGEWLPLDALRPWDRNPRKNDPAVPRVAASIRRFGFVAPIVIWLGGDRMVAGHTRLKAMRSLMAEDTSFVAKGAPGPGLVRVVFHEFDSEDDADAYALADNKLGELAEWDQLGVAEVLARIKKRDPSLPNVVGYQDAEVARLLAQLEPPPVDEKTENEGHATTRILGSWQIENGDVREVLARYPDNHFDALLSDPPYGLSDGKTVTWDDIESGAAKSKAGFMGKAWDCAVPGPTFWREVLRVLKPGAPIIAFFGTRTYHRGVVAIEDAGFEIRDCIAWMYGSGFPKSLDVSKAIDKAAGAERRVIGEAGYSAPDTKSTRAGFAGLGAPNGYERTVPLITAPATDEARLWDGYGTALKPSFEPAVLARKPLEGTVAENVAKWGVGGIAIDACRVGNEIVGWGGGAAGGNTWDTSNCGLAKADEARPVAGRWPANVILDEEAGAALDEQSGERRSTLTGRADPTIAHAHPADPTRERPSMFGNGQARGPVYADSGGASRFFYCAKPSRREREAGLGAFESRTLGSLQGGGADANDDVSKRFTKEARNVHPTVKPVTLARYLATMILPPPRDGETRKLLVPFSGSGSEVIGSLLAGWDDVTGVERETEYAEIARARIGFAVANPREFEVADDEPTTPDEDDELEDET